MTVSTIQPHRVYNVKQIAEMNVNDEQKRILKEENMAYFKV